MKAHNYRMHTIDGGWDIADFWICNTCGGSFGPVRDKDRQKPSNLWLGGFLAGTSLVNLGEDCDAARKEIDKYVESHPEYETTVRKERGLSATPPDHSDNEPCDNETPEPEPVVVLTIKQARALKRAIMGDHFESKDIDEAIEIIDGVENEMASDED